MTKASGLKIHVANLAQKVLMDHELSGQISDGNWENATPRDHWVSWCKAEVLVEPANRGINFYSMRKYDFLSEELLKVVRTRMILYVRLAQRFPDDGLNTLESLFHTIGTDEGCRASEAPEFHGEIPSWMANAASTSDTYKAQVEYLEGVLSNADDRNYLEKTCALPIKTRVEGVYNLSALRNDLLELKQIQVLRIKE